MTFGIRVKFEEIREKLFSDITDTFIPLGIAISSKARILSLNTSLDEPVYISLGVPAIHVRLEPNTTKIFNFCSNKARNECLVLAAKTQIFVKAVSTLPTTGAVWAEFVNGEGAQNAI